MDKEQEQQNTMDQPQEGDVNMEDSPVGMSEERPHQGQEPRQDGSSKVSIPVIVAIAVMVMVAATFYFLWF